jgi:aspartyl-tRNA(Asn)/glutamyl-tRNA(Gln) amidotransferase subunit B
VSDVKMEEGSLRIDANVSVRPPGTTEFGTRAEIKNLNSLRSLLRAVEYETQRQSALIEAGERVVQETRHWDEDGGRTISGRSKEEAHDYRYFPEPDLVPVAPTEEMRERVRSSMPELPAARRSRLIEAWGIKDEDARVLIDVPGLADYAERAVAAFHQTIGISGHVVGVTAGEVVLHNAVGTSGRLNGAKDIANWVRQDVLAYLNDRGLSPAVLAPEMLAELVGLVADGTISRGQAKDVLAESMAEEKWPRSIVEERGLAQVSDAGELGAAVDRVLAANPDAVEQYRASTDDKDRKKKSGFLMGQVMGELRGKGNAQVLKQLLDERLS